LLFADVLKGEGELAGGVLLHARRDADASGFRQAFEPCRDVYAITKDVAVLNDDVSHVDADPELDPTVDWHGSVPLGHRHLDLGRATQRVDDAGEFDQKPVSGGFVRPRCSAILGSISSRRCTFSRARVPSSSAPISRLYPGDVRGENGGQPTFDAFPSQSGAP
jgi:hypothetical protein